MQQLNRAIEALNRDVLNGREKTTKVFTSIGNAFVMPILLAIAILGTRLFI